MYYSARDRGWYRNDGTFLDDRDRLLRRPYYDSDLNLEEGIEHMAEPQTLSQLAKEIRQINQDNGWNVFQEKEWENTYKVPGILALIHSEVSEALEGFRVDDKENFLEELADTLIRVLDCAGGFETEDFDSIVRAKLDKNKSRGYKHGGKRV